jgi:hypothetical protein
MLKKRDLTKKKAELEQSRKKVRSLAERNRAKTRTMDNELEELGKEEKLAKKLKSGKLKQKDYDNQIEKIYKRSEYAN